ncbi:UNVERIFIED_CONTAM: Structural maintenance of chromosomes protein 2-2 [Sesamum calycinum]|uniref:Structural maintenance of chromosomes protein 2-2 n=1 Tax=Sesamum calycinum TaxID=2727403 RepID=A0AAW2JD30_9LAMI
MYIKEICLEGFKSYATRTVVPGFDPYFNAITGLNGSGKSNILDSICFVLGITNLQQVRASNLQELVYKQGQAGITKATVSIVFDNSDRSRSPLGYEDSPEITVTRQLVEGNKYLINGHLAQPSRVQNLFHSVQLNVNNPHFLIMQGRITKVLNMKPPEILSMLEEAAGTRMYENKKEAALKTLEKKQSKVDEIDKLLDQEILPALEKLRKERMQYMQWANGNAELDRLKRFCIAYEYVQAEKIRDNAVQCVQEIRDKILEIDATVGKMHEESQGMENRVSELSAEKEASMGGEIKSLSDKLDALSRDLVKETSVLKNEEDNLRTEKENAAKIERSLEESKLAAEEMAAAVKNAEDGAADLKKSFQDLSKSLDEHEKEYQVRAVEMKRSALKINSRCQDSCWKGRDRIEAVANKKNELDVKRKDVDKVKSALESLSYEDNIMEALQKDRTAEKILMFKVCVAKLIKVKDSSAVVALEVAAGGKLFNVVVDTENTGKQLLQKGGLRRRVTIIPLNKIQSHPVPQRVKTAAVKLVGKGNAEVALSLVGYDQELQSAMEYVFGSTFVCKTIDAAREVAFKQKTGTPSVTLEGDIFQPSGLLTGEVEATLLRKLHALGEAELKLSFHQNRLSEVDAKRIEEELGEAKSAIKEKKILYEECVAKVSSLEKSIHDHAGNRESRLKDLEKKIKAIKSQMQAASKNLKGHESERERLIMEMEAVQKEKISLESQLAALKKQINDLTLELDSHKTKVASVKKDHDEVQSELSMARKKIKECDSQIGSIVKEQQRIQQKISEANLERKRMENEVKRMEMDQKDCSLKVEKLIEKHAWIASEKQLFGRVGSDYDFESCDPHKAREDFEKLQAEQSGLEKRVNKKVMAMFEKAEDEYNDLISKKNILNDKSKIKMVIEELDEKKKETLKVTWAKVNKDFGSIFSTLLPGTMAKLEPPEGGSFLDGLEVRVAFGSVWKQSLSELSGGQRSLLALSLILALLLFKPAPLYILDEVDAALDLSHTQNIGRMIKTHFPHSQFIVVSLKEGMFNNANVLFRTKFVMCLYCAENSDK